MEWLSFVVVEQFAEIEPHIHTRTHNYIHIYFLQVYNNNFIKMCVQLCSHDQHVPAVHVHG